MTLRLGGKKAHRVQPKGKVPGRSETFEGSFSQWLGAVPWGMDIASVSQSNTI